MPLTSLQAERAEQARWRLRPQFARIAIGDKLVENEFLAPEAQEEALSVRLAQVLRFARRQAPYYAELFDKLGFGSAPMTPRAALERLPLLGKREVYEKFESLQPKRLPPGHKVWGPATSSGSTGRPTRVVHSEISNTTFTVINQRHSRWFRFDPQLVQATIRLASQMPTKQGSALADGDSLEWPRWRYAGRFYETGPSCYFNVTNPVEAQLAWLRARQPHYLITYSESLEHLAFASAGAKPCDSLRSLIAISEQLTPAMRRHVEQVFGAPVEQAYGLNEIGLVAGRCAAGRYHVHVEHCLVELLDEDLQPARPGASGRIAVTALNNLAMPLLRYDTDDLAEAVGGPCPCGRTLPSFGEIQGRYSRIAFLPEGTLGPVGALRGALEAMPPALARALRKFQVHQFRDNSFEMRLASAAPLPAAFVERLEAAWKAAAGSRGWPLRIVEVDDIPRARGGKFQDFTSDFVPAPDFGGRGPDGEAP